MLNESQQKPKPRRPHSIRNKRQDETNDVPIEIEKAKEEKQKQNKSTSTTHEDSTQGEYAYFTSQGARAGV